MSEHPPALPHGPIKAIFDEVYMVTGQMVTEFPEFPDVVWRFNRNMIIVREGTDLTIFNSVRLDDTGLAELEALGTVTNLVRIGALHTRDDGFYVERYQPTFWTIPGVTPDGFEVDRRLEPGGAMPFAGCTVHTFATTALPEAVAIIDRNGGIAVACDSLQNWIDPDEHFDEATITLMTELGFFQPANFGPLFMMRSQPEPSDYDALLAHTFKHALCGHGDPLLDHAHEAYSARATETFAG